MKWISVEDELPKPFEYVLLFNKDWNKVRLGWNHIHGQWFDCENYTKIGDISNGVTHWMPLPKTPTTATPDDSPTS